MTHILKRQAEIPYDFIGLVLGLPHPRRPFKIFRLSISRPLFGRPRPSKLGHDILPLKVVLTIYLHSIRRVEVWTTA